MLVKDARAGRVWRAAAFRSTCEGQNEIKPKKMAKIKFPANPFRFQNNELASQRKPPLLCIDPQQAPLFNAE